MNLNKNELKKTIKEVILEIEKERKKLELIKEKEEFNKGTKLAKCSGAFCLIGIFVIFFKILIKKPEDFLGYQIILFFLGGQLLFSGLATIAYKFQIKDIKLKINRL